MVTFDFLSTRKAAIDSGKYLYRVLRNWQNFALITVVASLVSLVLVSTSSFAQFSVPTSHGDNARTGANTNEVLLAPDNVDKNNFGRLFSYPLDYQSLAQPLYIPNVNIPGKGIHNVVYVATMADSVYAFDAESNAGPNTAPLWQVNFTNSSLGITTAIGPFLPCATTEDRGPGFTQEGIVATPAIDTNTNTMYVVAKILDNGTVRHQLHALDLGTAQPRGIFSLRRSRGYRQSAHYDLPRSGRVSGRRRRRRPRLRPVFEVRTI